MNNRHRFHETSQKHLNKISKSFVKNLNPEYPTNWNEKYIIEYYGDPFCEDYPTEFYYMEEMNSDDEILDEACKLFNLNGELK